jgi:prepilin-type N-terminal cleavage/methylation domain-containing protein
MLKRAFTLIELLVVIAIIAILAAILFPVFAQAKSAAKKTSSLSNNKQLALSAIMYATDVDDLFPVLASWGSSGAYATVGGAAYTPWPHLLQPYTKNADLFYDPQAASPLPSPPGFNSNINKLFGPNYGMNPYLAQQVSFPYATSSALHNTRSTTSISRPADIVLFTQKYSNSETSSTAIHGGWWYGAGTFFITLTTDPPDCASPGNVYYCAAGWGNNGFYGGSGGTKYLKNVEAVGAWTGGASLRGTKQAVVTFTDGHAASKAPGALAEGTNYNGAKGADGIPTQSDNQVVVQDIGREHWLGVQ